MPDRRYRVLAIATHPVQYMAPIFRRMAAHPALDLHVAYCSLRGAEVGHDPEFGANVQWDIPLLEGYSWAHLPNRGSGTESFFGLFNPGLWKKIRCGKYDAVLCYTSYVRASFWIAYFAARSCRAAFIFGCDQGSLESLDGSAWKQKIKKLAWPPLYRLANQIVVSSTGARELIRSLGIPDDDISLTPLAVDNEWWRASSKDVDRSAVRRSWDLTDNDAVVLFCAKLQPWKRPFDLLHAFAQANIPKSMLIFAGEGPLRLQLESEATALGIASRVRFLGFINQSQLPSIYTASDLMVLPSVYEAFGVVVNEAMLCGCPVVASDHVGAARDLIAPVNEDFIFPCGDVAALASILRAALADRARLAAFGQIGRKRMESWSPRENLAETVEAIGRAVKRIACNRAAPQTPSALEEPASRTRQNLSQ